MKVWGILEKAQVEHLASDPALAINARVYYNTATDRVKVYHGTAAAWSTIVMTDLAAVLTAKDYDGGTASNTSRMTLPKAAIATLTGLTRKAGTVAYATDTAEQRPYFDDGTSLKPLRGPVVTGTVASATAVVAANGFTPGGHWDEMAFIKGSGGAVTVTHNPQVIAGTKLGQRLTLICTDDTNTVEFKNGTGLDINGELVMTSNSALGLMWDGSNWRELFRRGPS